MATPMLSLSNARMARTPKRRAMRRTFIRQWRIHRHLTLEQLADLLEMTASHLSMLERGQRAYTQETLEAIAEALQTDPASLLTRDPSDPDPIWAIWDNAKQAERRMIVEIAKTVTKTSTSN